MVEPQNGEESSKFVSPIEELTKSLEEWMKKVDKKLENISQEIRSIRREQIVNRNPMAGVTPEWVGPQGNFGAQRPGAWNQSCGYYPGVSPGGYPIINNIGPR